MGDPVNKIEARGISVAYDTKSVLTDLDLAIPPGQLTVLLGPNGSGKSTVLRALAKLQRLDAGEILLDGTSVQRLPSKSFAKRLGMLAQGPIAPEGIRVVDLVRQGRYPHRSSFGGWTQADEDAVDRALALTKLSGLTEHLIDTLSGGQRQRAWIAMVLAQATPILLLDEPTTYLDLAHQISLMTLVRRLVDSGGKTVVAVLHDVNQAARYGDHLVMLKAGKIVAQGPVEKIVQPSLIEKVFGVEVGVFPDPVTGQPFCIPYRTTDPADDAP